MSNNELFKNIKTELQDGIEVAKIGAKLYRVYYENKKMFLLPITSVFDEVAREKHEAYLKFIKNN